MDDKVASKEMWSFLLTGFKMVDYLPLEGKLAYTGAYPSVAGMALECDNPCRNR